MRRYQGRCLRVCARPDPFARRPDGKKKDSSRVALERYLHYYTRYINHDQSLKMETEAKTKMEAKVEERRRACEDDQNADSAKCSSMLTSLQQDGDEADGELKAAGLAIGGFCLAWGLNAGQRKQFKAMIVSIRQQFPPPASHARLRPAPPAAARQR